MSEPITLGWALEPLARDFARERAIYSDFPVTLDGRSGELGNPPFWKNLFPLRMCFKQTLGYQSNPFPYAQIMSV